MKQSGWPKYSRAFDPAGEAEEFTTLAKLLSGYRELVGELGGNPDPFLDSAGIRDDALDDPGARISVCALGELLEHTALALGCPDFGLRLAERQSAETVMQPLDRLFRAAPTMGDVLACCVRHTGAFNSGLIMELDEQPGTGLHLLDFKLVDGLSLFPQFIEQLLLLTHNSVIWLSAGFARSRTVWLSHLNMAPPVAYARRFNTVVKFGQENDGIFFSDADLSARVAECNVERFAAEARLVAERFPERQDIDTKVRQMVFKMLTQSDTCTRQNVARQLGFQERTLNRRLSKGGTSFEAIRDEVRRSLAYRYLARADLPLTEIAGRLGYSELAVLSRCCRRWFGSSPRQLRQHLLAAKAGAARTEPPPRLVA
jgi:AraC-like DNA-binding protein